MKGKLFAALLAVCALALTGCSSSAPKAPAPLKIQGVGSVAVLGDSISVATATCGYNSTCNENSWATGSATEVNSHASRLMAEEGGNPIVTYNDAVAGAKASDLAPQVSLAVAQKPDYVAIEIGGNDYCAPSIKQMTSPTVYRQHLASVLATFAKYLPETHVFIGSVPDPMGVYNANKGNATARQVWSVASICQSLLASPTDASQQATERRNLVQQRAQAYNQALAAVCAEYDHCHYDADAIYNEKYSASDLSDIDYFHPSLAGQAKFSSITWSKGGVRDWLREATNPVTRVVIPSEG